MSATKGHEVKTPSYEKQSSLVDLGDHNGVAVFGRVLWDGSKYSTARGLSGYESLTELKTCAARSLLGYRGGSK